MRFEHETRWLRHARAHLRHLFPYLPGQADYNKRLRRYAQQLQALIRVPATDADLADESLADRLHAVECGRSRPKAKRSCWACPPRGSVSP